MKKTEYYESLKKKTNKKFFERFEKSKNNFPIKSINKRKELELMYKDKTKFLNQVYKIETTRTLSEDYMTNLLTSCKKYQIYNSFWIGKYCVDIFIPRFKLVIELDGEVHDKEFKMRKDNHKSNVLKKLGLKEIHIENKDINQYFLNIIKMLNKKNAINNHNYNKVMRDIHLFTILSHDTFKTN